jgi:hypothetical protein
VKYQPTEETNREKLKLPGKLNRRKEKDRREYEGKKTQKKFKKKMARRGGNGGGREPHEKTPYSEPPNSMVSPGGTD